MKRKLFMVAVVVLIFLGCTTFSLKNNEDEPEKIFQISVHDEELLTSSKEGYNSVKIYRQKNRLIVNAESDTAFFEGAQFIVESEGEIAPEDIEIIWMTVDGSTKWTEDNDRIVAEIKIYDNDELIFDTKINFMKRAFDALEDTLEKTAE